MPSSPVATPPIRFVPVANTDLSRNPTHLPLQSPYHAAQFHGVRQCLQIRERLLQPYRRSAELLLIFACTRLVPQHRGENNAALQRSNGRSRRVDLSRQILLARRYISRVL